MLWYLPTWSLGSNLASNEYIDISQNEFKDNWLPLQYLKVSNFKLGYFIAIE